VKASRPPADAPMPTIGNVVVSDGSGGRSAGGDFSTAASAKRRRARLGADPDRLPRFLRLIGEFVPRSASRDSAAAPHACGELRDAERSGLTSRDSNPITGSESRWDRSGAVNPSCSGSSGRPATRHNVKRDAALQTRRGIPSMRITTEYPREVYLVLKEPQISSALPAEASASSVGSPKRSRPRR